MADAYIALTGNPNSGKSTAFNAYTGARQRVGNYPGVTVERHEGTAHHNGEVIHLVDLPGTYSLTAYSEEELVVRRELVERPPLAVIDMLDASALERSLYLTVQLLELGQPLVLALNMMDEARSAGIRINTQELGRRLGMPVVETVARSGEGLSEALNLALNLKQQVQRKGLSISYGSDIDPVLDIMQTEIEKADLLADRYPSRWLALKILEGDNEILNEVRQADSALAEHLAARCRNVADHIRKTLNTSPEAVISDYRYGFVRDGIDPPPRES